MLFIREVYINTEVEDLIKDLNLVEAKYWKHFRASSLKDEYIIVEDDNNHLNFEFKPCSELPLEIKDACLEIYNRYNSQRTA